MNILAIDTSTNVLGIGLVNDEKVIAEYITNIKRNHSTRVLPTIEFLLNDCGYKIKDIDKIVVAKGPGSYTGLRIGVTVAKSLAWTLKKPLVGVSSLKVMASSSHYFNGLISPIMDARRGSIFTGLYEFVDGELIQVIEDQHIDAEEWAKQINEYNRPVLFVGDDTSIHKEVFSTILDKHANFAAAALNIPRPGELALLGKDSEGEDIHSFVPNYARLAEAEMKWREKTGK